MPHCRRDLGSRGEREVRIMQRIIRNPPGAWCDVERERHFAGELIVRHSIIEMAYLVYTEGYMQRVQLAFGGSSLIRLISIASSDLVQCPVDVGTSCSMSRLGL